MKILKRIEQRPVDLLWFKLRQLENTKALYEQNQNLPPNVRMANVQIVQNDIAAFKKKLKKRIGLWNLTKGGAYG
jgi:hypothetical protein